MYTIQVVTYLCPLPASSIKWAALISGAPQFLVRPLHAQCSLLCDNIHVLQPQHHDHEVV